MDHTPTCLGCGAPVHIPKSSEPLVCFRCRAAGSARRAKSPAVAFEKFASQPERPRMGRRLTGLLFALVLVIAALLQLQARSRSTAAPTEAGAATTPAPNGKPGGVEVFFDAPAPGTKK